MTKKLTIVVVGGGIAGITCIESLFLEIEQNSSIAHIVLVSESHLVKRVTNLQAKGRHLESFDISQIEAEQLASEVPESVKFSVIVGSVRNINHIDQTISYQQQDHQYALLKYDVLCLCHGSRPKSLSYLHRTQEIDERILVLRDIDSFQRLKERLASCKHLALVGNGGISLELIEKVSNCEKTWIVRDKSIGAAYFDPGAAKFLLDSLSNSKSGEVHRHNARHMHTSAPLKIQNVFGPSLGPDWYQDSLAGCSDLDSSPKILYDDEVTNISYNSDEGCPLRVETLKSNHFNCDLIIAAIGVEPNKIDVTGGSLETNSTGAIIIDEEMRTSLKAIYAAGDVVSCERWTGEELWFQMPLWTQARQMGQYMAKCLIGHISNQDLAIYFNFECFTHCTRFLGQRVILLGRYNAQGLSLEKDGYEVLIRVNQGKDYVKIILRDGRIIGAVLVGESGLEETIENLIYDKIDISAIKNQLLDDTVDIEDYFD